MPNAAKKKEQKQNAQKLLWLPVDKISPNPNQPRREFDEAALASLCESIRVHGVLQPLTVRKVGSGYELIAGERRLRASIAAGLVKVPCVLGGFTDEQSSVLALVENIQRRDLDFFEEAQAIASLISTYGLTQEQVAEKLGKSQPAIANKLRLTRLPDGICQRIKNAHLTERHARSLLRLPDEAAMSRALDIIIFQEYNVSQTDELIERMLTDKPKEKKKKRPGAIKDVRIFCNTVEKAVKSIKNAGLPVNIKKKESDDFVEYTVILPKKV